MTIKQIRDSIKHRLGYKYPVWGSNSFVDSFCVQFLIYQSIITSEIKLN